MTAHRQSALLLHGLNPDDQRWILSRLAAPDQSILRRHLTELKDLGIAGDSGVREAATATAPVSGAAALPATVAHASAAQMRLLLAEQPAWLVAHVLALDDWPWRAAYLANLPPPQRERLAAPRCAPLAPAAAASLLAHLNARLPAGAHAAPAAASKAQGLRRFLGRWL